MIGTKILQEVRLKEKARFATKQIGKRARFIGVAFGRPELQLMKTDILPSLPYFHARSAKHTAFYFAGYEEAAESGKAAQGLDHSGIANFFSTSYTDAVQVVGPVGQRWLFFPEHFNKFRMELEGSSKWRYSGGCDLLLFNSRLNADADISLDFSTSIALHLDKVSELIATPTVGQLFESIFRYAEEQDEKDPTWGLSDYLGIQTIRNGFWDAIVGVLPEAVRKPLGAARHLVVENVALS